MQGSAAAGSPAHRKAELLHHTATDTCTAACAQLLLLLRLLHPPSPQTHSHLFLASWSISPLRGMRRDHSRDSRKLLLPSLAALAMSSSYLRGVQGRAG